MPTPTGLIGALGLLLVFILLYWWSFQDRNLHAASKKDNPQLVARGQVSLPQLGGTSQQSKTRTAVTLFAAMALRIAKKRCQLIFGRFLEW